MVELGADLVQGSIKSVGAWRDGVRFDGLELIEVEVYLGEYRFVAFLGNQFDWPVLQVNECELWVHGSVVVLVVLAWHGKLPVSVWAASYPSQPK